MAFLEFELPFLALDPTSPYELLHGSCYVFLLSKNIWAMLIGVLICFLQISVLVTVAFHGEKDEETCQFQCEINQDGDPVSVLQTDQATDFGRAVMMLVLWAFTWPELSLGLQLAAKAWLEKSWDHHRERVGSDRKCCKHVFLCMEWYWSRHKLCIVGLIVASLGTLTLFIAGWYTWSTSLTDSELAVNIVGILYIMDVDEKAFQLASGAFPTWHTKILQSIRDEYPSAEAAAEAAAEAEDPRS